MWDSEQRYRLALEKAIQSRCLPDFAMNDPSGETNFTGWHTPEGSQWFYKLMLAIPPHFPDEEPSLYVVSPNPLRQFDQTKTINEMGWSHDFHTKGTGPNGCVEICCPEWRASRHCVDVLFSGMYWLSIYEKHLATGMTINEIMKKEKQNHG